MNINNFLSERINSVKPSASMSMNEKLIKLKKQGKEIINLTIGQPDFNTPESIKDAGISAITNNFTHYTTAKGIPELLQSIGSKLQKENNVDVDPDKNILVVPGIKQAIYYINCCLINPGDEGIIFEPYWLTYWDSLKLCDGIPVPVFGVQTNDFKPTIQQIKNKISDKTKYILFSNPCNPTGSLWDRNELEEIVEIARNHDIFVISDEIYEKIVFDNNEFVSTASLEGAKDITITLNGFSKGQAMTGWRIGYAVGHEDIIKALLKTQQQIATCVSSISQKAAVIAYDGRDQIQNMVKSYEKRRNLIVDGLNSIKGFSCNKPRGTFYAFADISALDMGSIKATDYLLENAGVGVVPGVAYGKNCDNYIRLSFATSEENIKRALIKLEEVFGK